MGTPDNTDTITAADIEQLVSKALVQKDDGSKTLDYTKIPEVESNPFLQAALDTELRRRNTQAEYTKTRQENAKLKAQTEVLQKSLPEIDTIELPPELIERQEAIEELKNQDLDAWYAEKRQFEEDLNAFKQERINSIYSEAMQSATTAEQLSQREMLLENFNAKHPNKPLTPETLDKYTPPIIMEQLNNGEITFDKALELTHNIIYGSGVIANPKDPGMKSLGEVGAGSNTPTPPSIEDTSIF